MKLLKDFLNLFRSKAFKDPAPDYPALWGLWLKLQEELKYKKTGIPVFIRLSGQTYYGFSYGPELTDIFINEMPVLDFMATLPDQQYDDLEKLGCLQMNTIVEDPQLFLDELYKARNN